MSRSQFWVRMGSAIIAIALAIALAASAVAGRFPLWLRSSPGPAAGSSDTPPRPAASGTASPSTVPVQSSAPALPAMSLQQMAGQRVIYSYGGLKPPAELLRLISHGDVGGVIFFGQNVSTRTQLAKVVAELDQANASPLNPVRAPLLLMTDQEGGIVRRLPGAPLLSERQIGESADPAAAATSAGASAGLNLRGIGLNTNLAPVLDVYRQPGDFDDQFQRSYSMNPAVVAELGAAFITAQQRQGVAATAKHFPGLGAAAQPQDTDMRPVTLNLPLATIRNIDELPYKRAIAAGVRLVMVSWAVYPALDPGRPASRPRSSAASCASGSSSPALRSPMPSRLGRSARTARFRTGGCWRPRPGWTSFSARRRTSARASRRRPPWKAATGTASWASRRSRRRCSACWPCGPASPGSHGSPGRRRWLSVTYAKIPATKTRIAESMSAARSPS